MATVSRDPAGRYFVSFSVEEIVQPLPVTDKSVGVDMGLIDVAVTSDGDKVAAPRHLRQAEKRLKRATRIMQRRKQGSGRWEKQRQRVARLHARVADSRADFLHKLSRRLIDENQVIAIEDLNVRGMQRGRLSKSIGDAGLSELRRQLTYKAVWYGRELLVIDRFAPTSKVCSACGCTAELSLSDREWTCQECGLSHDRDVNAAINILHTASSAGINARGEYLAGVAA